MKIGIVGAGWYGSHLALVLKKAGHEITLFEKKEKIFQGISGNYGIRLHAGPHYPRSEETRKGCHINFQRFIHTYPELVHPHQYSVYGLGDMDVNFQPSKVSQSKFDAVCQETPCQKIDPEKWGYQHLLSVYNLDEPSIAGGKQLRTAFTNYLAKANVKVVCNFNVTAIEQTAAGINITDGNLTETFDYVINSTCFENLLPEKSLPYDIDVTYQPCLALIYKDKAETIAKPPFSFIVMDGLYPCIMPFNDRYGQAIEKNENGVPYRLYMMTHGKWTIMGSYQSYAEANHILQQLNNEIVNQHIRPRSEADMIRFWPAFKGRFEYLCWTGSILAKPKTEKEFRGAFTFAEINRSVVHVFPGKVACIFNVADEVLKLLHNEQKDIIQCDDFRFVRDGVLHEAIEEVTEKPHPDDKRNTCQLQTYAELVTEQNNPSLEILNNLMENEAHATHLPASSTSQSDTLLHKQLLILPN